MIGSPCSISCGSLVRINHTRAVPVGCAAIGAYDWSLLSLGAQEGSSGVNNPRSVSAIRCCFVVIMIPPGSLHRHAIVQKVLIGTQFATAIEFAALDQVTTLTLSVTAIHG